MSNDIMNLQLWQIGAAYVFIALLLVIVRKRGIGREREILIASIRMTLQLVLVGYVLVYIFENTNPLMTILAIAVMEAFAIDNIFKMTQEKLTGRLKNIIAFSMVTGTLTSIFYFLFVVIRIYPWFNPQYFIPIAGMIIGNSMTGISLGVKGIAEGMRNKRALVESSLMLGATPARASREIVNSAFDSAILPTINSMVRMGIVSLPGMMTGQILSGTSPLIATKYQIAIMLGIVGSVALSVILFVILGYRTFFNQEDQLIQTDN